MAAPSFGKPTRQNISVAHLHLLSVINTESHRFPSKQVVRILDAGCGDGRLIAVLTDALPRLNPTLTFEVHGFDVYDFPNKNIDEAPQLLLQRFPKIPWDERIVRIPMDSRWPYPDQFFDIIVSNQVGEHLRDHGHFFGEVARCLDEHGFSVHLFPLKHVVMEWHVLVPFAHRIRNHDVLRTYIKVCSKLGFGPLRRAKRPMFADGSASESEYVIKYTGYISYSDLLSIVRRHGLLVSMRYTKEFYIQKIRRTLSRPPLYEYPRKRSIIGDWVLVFLLRYVQGVTVVLKTHDTAGADQRSLCQ